MDAILHSVLNEPKPMAVLLTSEGKIHRGYVDDKGRRFTQEQCNLSKSNEADNLSIYSSVKMFDVLNVLGVSDDGLERCENCF